MRFDPAHFRHAVGNRAPRWPFALKPDSSNIGHWSAFGPPGNSALREFTGRGSPAAFTGTPEWIASAALSSRAVKLVKADADFLNPGNISSTFFDGSTRGSTLTMWFELRALPSAWAGVITKGRETGSTWVGLWLNPSNQWIFGKWSGGGSFDINAGAAAVGLHRVVLTQDGTNARIYMDGVEIGSDSFGSADHSTASDMHIGHAAGTGEYIDIDVFCVAAYERAWPAAEVWADYDPGPRWDKYREARVPRVWPVLAGGAVARTATVSLQATLQRQASVLASADAALRAEAVLSALAGAALQKSLLGSVNLGLAVQAIVQAQTGLDTALISVLGQTTGLDANLTAQSAAQRGAALDAAIQNINLLSGALEAALRAPDQETAVLDAWLALSLGGAASLDAVALREQQIPGLALQSVLRASLGRAAALDAVIGLMAAAAGSRTFKVAGRGGHSVAGGLRRSLIQSGNRRH